VAGNLARAMADCEALQAQLDAEGHVIENQRGTPIANPLHSVIETLTRRVVALSRMLHVHPEAKQGESRHQGKAKKAADDAVSAVSGLDDDLIPGVRQH
jgi:phage terminase small subunit